MTTPLSTRLGAETPTERAVKETVGRYDKHKAYRDHLRAAGRCERCGKDAYPFALCRDHRLRKKVAYVLNRGARYGLFRKSADAKFSNGDSNARVGARGFYNENPNDSRLAPRPHMRRGSAFVGFAMRLSKQASEL